MDAATDIDSEAQDDTEAPQQQEVPDRLMCPMTLSLMVDPVLLAGFDQLDNPNLWQTYERNAIEHYLCVGPKRCPKTNIACESPCFLQTGFRSITSLTERAPTHLVSLHS